jgi:hypothetical protein
MAPSTEPPITDLVAQLVVAGGMAWYVLHVARRIFAERRIIPRPPATEPFTAPRWWQ